MEVANLQKKLLAAARSVCPAEHVPYGFERRVMARLLARPADVWEEFARGLLKAAAPCVGISVLLLAWSLFAAAAAPAPGNDLGAEFDRIVLAAADQEQTPDIGW